jgi:hypothetical protein
MPDTTGGQQPKLLDEVCNVLRFYHYSIHICGLDYVGLSVDNVYKRHILLSVP